ncbi:hypothetical protein ASG31_16580 [Chryseobacterium sp. Leaf404]|uniref:hypothetical protein n=1 Tax=unclassified Chryseobacterium TaxID=2593645 RepID=UPI0006F4BAE8|nr:MULTISPECIES: hypothetical protein [unclassified Chryseobacterium]KQT21489.1 hypothetical protein ASG31_16580 [Chryseobacterium sp. Leaf404]
MKLYLDIDGVLLTSRQTKAAENVEELIIFAVQNFDCYWLTTHCKGNARQALNYLKNYFPINIVDVLRKVKATNWDTLKTEGIDFSSNFIWLEDYPLNAEKLVLKKNKSLNNLIEINLNQEHELLNIVKKLKILINEQHLKLI